MSSAIKRQEARAIARHVRMGPRKARIVIDLIRGKSVEEALAMLRFVPRRAAEVVEKALRSAKANAVHNYDLDEDLLYVAAAWVDGGPTAKRFQPRARGQAYPILKRTCHINVLVRERGEG